ncbi:M48 family metallopeptidase [uncultured Jatrophihabitans sp.]|uniref:M48 family metallopeptidase n=1 Tax=uncultured Jatrophihabitans sp. TaxID=1610747 RepID=UPI0035CC0C5B
MTSPSVDAAGRTVLTGISSRAFEHPADRAALTALRSVPGFDQLIKLASGMLRERQYRLAYLASSVRVGPRQFPDLDALLSEVVGVLDTSERPELYVVNDPVPNAMTLGVDRPFITITSGLYELTDNDERRFVLGHEVGHAMSGHALYQSLLMHLLNLAGSFGWVPAGGLGLRALIAALREWQRKAELSGDRAGLLAGQDVDAALRLQMKMAGGAHLDRIDADAFLAQAAEYEGAGDLRDGVLKLLNTERTTHPFSVVRAAEIRRWAASEEFERILAGDYPLRADDRDASFTETAKEAARTYRTRIEESSDPLVGAVRNVGATVGTAAESVVDWFNRVARGPEPAGRHATDDSEPTPDPGL